MASAKADVASSDGVGVLLPSFCAIRFGVVVIAGAGLVSESDASVAVIYKMLGTVHASTLQKHEFRLLIG